MAKKSKTAKTPKKAKKQLYCVETYSTFRHQYLVEALTAEGAEVYVEQLCRSNDPPEEWQQSHLGERVVSLLPTTRKQAEREHVRPEPKVLKCHWLPVERFILHADDEKSQ
jgi:hypothetical protein